LEKSAVETLREDTSNAFDSVPDEEYYIRDQACRLEDIYDAACMAATCLIPRGGDCLKTQIEHSYVWPELERLQQVMADSGLTYEIIVVDNGSTDSTAA